MMNRQLTKSDVLDIVLVVLGLFCLIRAIAVISMEFFMSLIQPTEFVTITRSPWASALYAALLLALSYGFIFQRKAILHIIMRRQPPAVAQDTEEPPACYVTAAFWVQMFGLYEFMKALFSMAQHVVWHASSLREHMPQGYLWKQEAPHAVVLIVALLLIVKSKKIGQYLDKLRNTQPSD